MKRLISAALFLAVGCSGPPAPASPGPVAAPPVSATGSRATKTLYQRIPDRVGSYHLTERAVVTGLATDSLYRFANATQTNVTVFVFDVPADVRVDPDSQKWTAREGAKFKLVMDLRRQRGDFRRHTIAFSDTSRKDFGGPRLLEHEIATAVLHNDGATTIEFQFLYLVDGKFLKVRATVPFEGWEQTTVQSFARGLAGVVARGG